MSPRDGVSGSFLSPGDGVMGSFSEFSENEPMTPSPGLKIV